ncbi:MAG TPA: hypothetical protein VMM59_01905 [Thermohalobaculum sp.]|nr:hypothetical protein [Thermohalobaculum sp.]
MSAQDTRAPAGLRELIAAELDRPPGPAAEAMAARLAARPGVAAVVFYGARMRQGGGEGGEGGEGAEGDGDGPLDFYLLTDGNRAYHGPGLAALANRLLPPSVYRETPDGAAPVEAKVAVISLRAFRARMRRDSLDTTLWARFAQPVVLAWARTPADRAAVIDAVAAAVETASWWAARLAPDPGDPGDPGDPDATWSALFRRTYASELRVEGGRRAGDIVAAAPGRYRRLHALLIAGRAAPDSDPDRNRAKRAWARRRALGKALNAARLLKAACTYRGGIAYALAKVERHSGRPVALKPWQRRWPWLAAPLVVWRLWRERRLR